MATNAFETAYQNITDRLKADDDRNQQYVVSGGVGRWVLKHEMPVTSSLHLGRAQLKRGLNSPEGFDDETATVFTTDYSTAPPTVRWLIPTSVGRMAGITEGHARDALLHSIPSSHSDQNPLGREIVNAVQAQLETLPQVLASTSS